MSDHKDVNGSGSSPRPAYEPEPQPLSASDPGTAGYAAAPYPEFTGAPLAGDVPAYGDGSPGRSVRADGRMSLKTAMSWALRTVFQNWSLWILLPLVFGLVIIALTVGTVAIAALALQNYSPEFFGSVVALAVIVSVVLCLFIYPVWYNAAVKQLDQQRVTWKDAFSGIRFFPVLGVMLVIGLLQIMINVVVSVVCGLPVDTVFDPAVLETAEVGTWQMISYSLLTVIIAFACVPLGLAVYMTADGFRGWLAAIPESFRVGMPNILRLIALWIIVTALVTVLGLVTLGLALLVILPFSSLAQAHVYRQCTGQSFPVA